MNAAFALALAALALAAGVQTPPPASLRLDAPSPWYVGQALPIEAVPPEPHEAASGQWPSIAWGQILDRGFPRAWIWPTRPGGVLLPAIRLQLGEGEARTPARRFTIEPVPSAGRDAAYLGGVGPLALRRHDLPPTVPVGQEFTMVVSLEGPGGFGTRPPSGGFDWLPPPDQVEVLHVESRPIADPPGRAVAYRLRAIRPGALRLPAIAVSSFQPNTRRFETARLPAAVVEVVPPPVFTPGPALDFSPPPAFPWPALLGLIGLLVCGLLLHVARRRAARQRARDRLDPRSALRQARAWLASTPRDDPLPEGMVRHVGAVLRAKGHPSPAWPTPAEAAAILAASPDFAQATRALLSACDDALFAPNAGVGASGERLRAAFADWLEQAARDGPLSSS
jgi:hypothetical protein